MSDYKDMEHKYYLAFADVKRLEKAITTWKEEEVAWKETEAALLARVEELERQANKMTKIADKAGWNIDGYHITPKMIDAAVDFTENIYSGEGHLSLAVAGLIRDYLWRLLNRLNIYRCEECKGNGSVWAPWDDNVACKCPDCNGHGWVIK